MTLAQSTATTNAALKTTISIAGSSLVAGDHAAFPRSEVLDDALDRVGRDAPRRALDHSHRVGTAGVAANADAVRREVDVLGVVLTLDARCEQVGDVHLRAAAPCREFLDPGVGP